MARKQNDKAVKPYRDFADFLAGHFPVKMQKLTVDAGLSCPNRDGTVGTGGCIYCNNAAFSPGFGNRREPVTVQLERSRAFFARKYPAMRYLAYFQSYTATHGDPDLLMAMYGEALGVDGVDGLIIGTRPDCMPQHLLDRLAGMGRFVMIEYGAESSHDRTLQLINRCHTWADTVDAVRRTHASGLPVGLHFIMGLPGETADDMMATVDRINDLPVDVVKFHQLQIVRGTELCRRYENGTAGVEPFGVDAYLDLCCRIVGRLRSDIAIERFVSQSPADLLAAPRWGLKNHEFTDLLRNRLNSESNGK